MTAQFVVKKRPGETLSEAVAARLRGLLSERKISHKAFGEMVGWDRGVYQRRLSGEVALDLKELELIEERTGITVYYLLTGDHQDPTIPPPPPYSAPPVRDEARVIPMLRAVPTVSENAGAIDIDDDAQAYVALSEGQLLPRLDSNQQPFGCRSGKLARQLISREITISATPSLDRLAA